MFIRDSVSKCRCNCSAANLFTPLLPLRVRTQKQEEEADPDEIMEVQKQHTFSYWAVDLPRAFDMIQLRLHVMRQLLKVCGSCL